MLTSLPAFTARTRRAMVRRPRARMRRTVGFSSATATNRAVSPRRTRARRARNPTTTGLRRSTASRDRSLAATACGWMTTDVDAPVMRAGRLHTGTRGAGRRMRCPQRGDGQTRRQRVSRAMGSAANRYRARRSAQFVSPRAPCAELGAAYAGRSSGCRTAVSAAARAIRPNRASGPPQPEHVVRSSSSGRLAGINHFIPHAWQMKRRSM